MGRIHIAMNEHDDLNDLNEELQDYAHIWTDERLYWVLLGDEESPKKRNYMPYNIKTWRVLVLEDNRLHRALVARMIQEGIPQVTDQQVFGKKVTVDYGYKYKDPRPKRVKKTNPFSSSNRAGKDDDQ